MEGFIIQQQTLKCHVSKATECVRKEFLKGDVDVNVMRDLQIDCCSPFISKADSAHALLYFLCTMRKTLAEF